MNRASEIVKKLLEADEPSPEDLVAGVYATPHHKSFEDGVVDILTDARRFFDKLVKEGDIDLLQREQARLHRFPFDDSSIAQAILMWTIERRGAQGPKRALQRLKRYTRFRY